MATSRRVPGFLRLVVRSRVVLGTIIGVMWVLVAMALVAGAIPFLADGLPLDVPATGRTVDVVVGSIGVVRAAVVRRGDGAVALVHRFRR